MLTIQCILRQERGSEDGGGEAGKAKSQVPCAGGGAAPLQEREEQNSGSGSTQGTEVAGKGVGMRSRALAQLLELGERGSTPRVPLRCPGSIAPQSPWQSRLERAHTHIPQKIPALHSSPSCVQLGNTAGRNPCEPWGCKFSRRECCGL